MDSQPSLPRLQPRSSAPRPPPPAAFVVELPPAGDLNFFDAPRVLGWSIATGYNGCLWLAPLAPFAQPPSALSDDSTPHRELYLESGGLIGALSTIPGDSLIEFLQPLWTRQQMQRARQVVAALPPNQLREQLSSLIDAKLLKRVGAQSILANYVNMLCSRALCPGPGRYRVLSRALTNNERIEPPLPLRRLLVEGLRKGASLDFLHLRLGPPTTCMRPTAVIGATEGGAALMDMGLSTAEELALHHLNGRHTLAEISKEAGIGEHAVYALAYALLCLGAAAVPRQISRPGAISKPRAGAVSSASPAQTDPSGDAAKIQSSMSPGAAPEVASTAVPPQRNAAEEAEAAIRRVQQKYRQVEESDYFALLELLPSASTDDILQAHEKLRAEFTPAALPYRCRGSMDRELRQIARALDEARAILSNDATRRAYLERLNAPPKGPEP